VPGNGHVAGRRVETGLAGELRGPNLEFVTRWRPRTWVFFRRVDEIALAKRDWMAKDCMGTIDRRLNAMIRALPLLEVRSRRVGLRHRKSPSFFMAQEIEDRGAFGSAFDYVLPEAGSALE